MSTELDLSVIILTYNVCEFARQCVHSLLSDAVASRHTTEIIVVDNGSTDDTAPVLRAEFPAIRLIVNKENLGCARGNNVGLAAATGRYLFKLDSDTRVCPGALDALIDFMDAHPEAGACGPQLLNEDGSLQPSGRPLPSPWSVFIGMTRIYRLWKRDFYLQPGRDYNQVKQVSDLSGAALLVRKEVYDQCGGFDPNLFLYYEDVDWCKRIHEAGYALYYVPHSKVVHTWQRITRVIPDLAYRSSQESLRYYISKHHGSLAHFFIQLMLCAKEIALIAACTMRNKRAERNFHRRMLANVFRPLQATIPLGIRR
jgi:N-acetylglucosaminyl-diphospho-decaprenol L-rhamnosyltransferase